MRRVLTTLLALSLGTLALGCQDEGRDPAIVDDLRILAVRADPPEVAPGDATVLSALVADPLGAGRTVDYFWAACVLPFGEELSDCGPETALPLGTEASPTVPVPADILDGGAPTGGIDVIVLLVVSAGEESDQAIKRVRVSTVPTPNTNPVFDTITIAGSTDSVVTLEPGMIELEAQSTDASIENFEIGGEPQTEEMKFTWFISTGGLDNQFSFGDPRAGDAMWELDAVPARLWVVLRDQRGGTDWQIRQIDP